jgi:hypothetical protein
MRREERKNLRVRAWIGGMGPRLQECFVHNISCGGARIIVERGHPPDEFHLYFSEHASNFRKCIVCWRKGDSVGVRFERETLEEALSAGCQNTEDAQAI